ncbi:MAG: hypothetical protein NTZ17_04205 [Phycisphaerae bacterium]|nr:hypothetical protein [Phycisphaerae bacterium]
MRSDIRVNTDRVQADVSSATGGDVRVVVAAVAGLAAAWMAAGSVGLWAHPLQRALTLGLLAAAVLVLPFPFKWTKSFLLGAGAAAVIAASMMASSLPVVNVSGTAFVLVLLALRFSGRDRSVLLSAATGVAVLALYRTAYTTIPLVWMAADWLGQGLGRLAGLLSARRLNVGATFAGLDYLVVMLALSGTWIAATTRPRRWRAIYALGAILAGQLLYLILLSYVPDLLALVPRPAAPEKWSWAGLFHKAVPWNVPVLAVAIHALIAGALFRWSAWMLQSDGSAPRVKSAIRNPQSAILLAALLLPVVTSLYPASPGLQGKKIVFYEKGFLNWLKPTYDSYGRLGSGMYGMLPVYLESLGARA